MNVNLKLQTSNECSNDCDDDDNASETTDNEKVLVKEDTDNMDKDMEYHPDDEIYEFQFQSNYLCRNFYSLIRRKKKIFYKK